jgi:hypothetical protein
MNGVYIGGQVDRTVASFSLWGDTLDPDVVTAALQRAPSRAFKKGDPTPSTHRNPNLYRQRGTWQLTSTLPREVPLDRHLRHLLDQLSPHAIQIQAFVRDGYEAEFFCGLFLERWNRGSGLRPSTLSRIAALGASLGLDIYGPDGPIDVADDDEAG